MKACVFIKNAKRGRGRAQTLSLIKHCLSEGRSVKEVSDGQSRVATIDAFGLVGGLNEKKPGKLRDNLLRQNHDTKSKDASKHVVLSIEDTLDPVARAAALRILRRMAFEFLKVYAPGCAALAFAHNDRKHPHLHLVVANSDSNRAVHWKPKLLRQMQSMEWLSKDLQILVQSGRRESSTVKHEPYPTAKLSLAAELAAMTPEDLENISWVRRGKTRVFIYKGRRVRERTVDKERNKHENTNRSIDACGVPSGTPETSRNPCQGGATLERRGNCDIEETGTNAATGNRTGQVANNGAVTDLVEALLNLRKKRKRSAPANPAPEIKLS